MNRFSVLICACVFNAAFIRSVNDRNAQTMCRETDHSPEAVMRYTTKFLER